MRPGERSLSTGAGLARLAIRGLVLAAWLGVGCGPAGTTTPEDTPGDAASRPNMVVVLVDDMRWDEFGAAGHPYVQTPNIDRIAREGAFFENAFTTTPLCSPARATLLTGLYPMTHGITDNLARNEQSHQLETFPKMLNAAGYETAFVGKWHMGNDDSPRPGFTRWAGMKGQGEAIDPEINRDGVRTKMPGYVTDILTDLAVDFVQADRETPFLLYLSHKALHPNITQLDDGSTAAPPSGLTGFIAAERHRGMYADDPVPRRKSSGVAPTDKPALMRPIGELPPLGAETITSEETIHQRHEMLMAVDEGLGRVLESLEAQGVLDDTVVVVTSDHGYWYGEHGLSAERRLAYEEGLRVPLLVRYPRRVSEGLRIDAMTIHTDLAPTMLELGGVTAPVTLEGRSLVPLLDGEDVPWRSSFLVEYYSDTVFQRIDRMGYQAVRTAGDKYIRYRDLDGMDELYDLRADPFELNNLLSGGESPEELGSLEEELRRLVSSPR